VKYQEILDPIKFPEEQENVLYHGILGISARSNFPPKGRICIETGEALLL
jgi:hypothetical protein